LLVAVGIVSGIVNAIAGGGSFLTLPALMLFGLPAADANGTNRVGIALQSATASVVFHRHSELRPSELVPILIPALLGAVAGALVATVLPEQTFRVVFGLVFVVMAVTLVFEPRILLAAERPPISSPWVRALVFFAIGVYGGFIQAGVGLFLLIAMRLVAGRELVASNAVKNAIVFLYTLAALAVFAAQSRVQWVPGLVLAIGSAMGGHIGAKLAIHRGNRFVVALLVLVMLATGANLLYPYARALIGGQ
jgi:uncharacterized membrane protein YfcA